MRFRFGADAKLDSPANLLKSPVYKTLGNITDRGIEFSGYAGFMEWSLGVMNGIDSINEEVTSKSGEDVMVMRDVRNGSKPVVARVGIETTSWLELGVSGVTGKFYPVYSHYDEVGPVSKSKLEQLHTARSGQLKLYRPL
jgi:hypothetical protein